ncbi:phage baseplate assembly protein V [Sedimentitalea sp.]|uniref:phage baseplate assembly protein V n=1 Tax=Sedimentitalea sp. TaxID=2048915 RepID=UPI003298F348
MAALDLNTDTDPRVSTGLGGLFYGVYPAIVTDLNDQQSQGRVRVKLPWASDDGTGYEIWMRLATMFAGADHGSWFLPHMGDEVLVAFASGNPRHGYIIGALWNGQDAPPEEMDSESKNEIQSLSTRSGVKVTLDDTLGSEQMILETPGGQKMTLRDSEAGIALEDSNGNTVTMEASGISVDASSKVSISASQVEVSASMVTVDAGMSKFSGVVKADTVICNSVVSSSYTPGAGNIW